MAEMDDDELLDALGVEVAPLKLSSRTPREERIIAGLEDILRFHQAHGSAPLHGEGRDIFERLYAVRLDQLRKLPEAQALLAELDIPRPAVWHSDSPRSMWMTWTKTPCWLSWESAMNPPIKATSLCCAMYVLALKSGRRKKSPTARRAKILTSSNRYLNRWNAS